MSTRQSPPISRRKCALGAAASLAIVLGGAVATPVFADESDETDSTIGTELYRPGYHYTPAKNWVNDPNGMVYYNGTYHLFYQHNPESKDWGNMSWGHATSTDLMNWEEQPLAIPQTFNDDGESIEDIFSGSVVVDKNNTAGFAKEGETALIAIYTSAYTDKHPKHAGKQAQSIAYSVDDGQTWTKYEGNPVSDRDSANYRDPKVFWYDDGEGNAYWVMVAVEATDHKIVMYKSSDLKDWEHLSDFGPHNAVGGVWECPDLFPVVADDGTTKWIMVLNLNPGSVAGGSGGQYFIGDFDGETFTAENIVEDGDLPEVTGDLIGDFGFESGTYGEWTIENLQGEPFGDAPAAGALNGQTEVSGFEGERLVNSFNGGDWGMGRMTSPSFELDTDYLTFKVGGGNLPYEEGTFGNEPPEGELLWNGFEPDGDNVSLEDFGWTMTGDFDGGVNPSDNGGNFAIGDWRINTNEGGPNADDNTGTMTSPEFEVTGNYISMLVGGGGRDDHSQLGVQVLADGDVVDSVTGPRDGHLNWEYLDVSDYVGQDVQLRIVDDVTEDWAHITVDHVVMGDVEPTRHAEGVAVNLLVEGEVVKSTSGNESEALEWVSWDVSEYAGQEAQIQIVDFQAEGWGHILADHFMKADSAAPKALESYDWLDWGPDYYAAVSYSNMGASDLAADGKQVMQSWMNNWLYAGVTPTDPWRSGFSLPREIGLTKVDGKYELTSTPVASVADYENTAKAYELPDGQKYLAEGVTAVEGISGDMLKIDLTLNVGDEGKAGIIVRAPEGAAGTRAMQTASETDGTEIGYNASTGRVYVDRTRSGVTNFNGQFPSVHTMPVEKHDDGTVSMSIYVDRSSVELFTADDTRAMTHVIYPAAEDQSVLLFSEGGDASVEDLTITPMNASVY
ncbi:GH32 C-terminal domain-containing protein, partial [Ancrocorticia populi]|uniref:glycoside hydrolase family 32 protein n=1 Tax=Ancrocorticia populi TaxID=2175228 RepID=UPI003F8ECE45